MEIHPEDTLIHVPENIVTINLDHLAHNYHVIERHLSRTARVMPVVKADAYGHGAVGVARRLVAEGAEALALARVPEAVELRQAGITVPLFVLGGVWPEEMGLLLEHALVPMLLDLDMARALAAQAAARHAKAEAVLKIDTGMGRLGVFWERAEEVLSGIKSLETLELIGLTTHLTQADKADKAFTRVQAGRFIDICRAAEGLGFTLTHNNIANSAAVVDLPELAPDYCRTGIITYGLLPSDEVAGDLDLRPVMGFTSRVMQVKEVPAGTGVSYHQTWIAEGPTTLAAVPVGYCHGYLRSLSNQGRMLVHGQSRPIRGRVCMNATMIDVTDLPGVKAGDEVTVIGDQGAAKITATDLATRAGTINYEITCLIGTLNQRQYVGQ
ncbi:MAG: alanine racemase [Proteobacteria bacterium]|nr:alanine racemase [Pseudomonadota bacterium]MBU1742858.1 alanine racemase [Pseudomonadota bacterium]